MTTRRIAARFAALATLALVAGCVAPQATGLLPAPPMAIKKEEPARAARKPVEPAAAPAPPKAAAPSDNAAATSPATPAPQRPAADNAAAKAPAPVVPDNVAPAPPPVPVGWKEYGDAIAKTREAIARQKPGDAVAAWKPLEDTPYRADAIFTQGVLLHLSGDIDGAEAQYRRGTDKAPVDEASAANLLGIYLMKGEREKARALVDRAIPAAGGTPLPELVNNAGAVLLEAGETERAAALLSTLAARNDNGAAASWNRAVLAWRKGDVATARAISDRLPEATTQLWSVTASRSAWDNAHAARIAPAYATAPGGDKRLTPLAANFAAFAKYRGGKPDEASKLLADATKDADASPEMLSNLGLMLVERGRWKEGRETLERVTKSNPGFPEAWFNLGLFREVYAGDAAGAVECYRKYVSLGGYRKDEVSKWIDWLQKPAPPSSP